MLNVSLVLGIFNGAHGGLWVRERHLWKGLISQMSKIQNNLASFKKGDFLGLYLLKRNWALFKLVNSAFWRSTEKWFMSFVFTFLFVAVFGCINQAILLADTPSGNNLVPALTFKSSLTGLASLMVISAGLNGMPVSIMEIKESVLMKRIGSTPIKPWMFILTVSFFYSIVMTAQILITMFTIFLFFGSQDFSFGSETVTGNQLFFTGFEVKIGEITKSFSTNWGSYIFGLFYTKMLSVFLAVLIVSLTRKSASASMIGMMVFFWSMFLSGMLFPLSTISRINVLYVLSFFSPFRYVNVLSSLGWNGGVDVFDLDKISANFNTIESMSGIKDIAEVWTGYFVPLIFIVAAMILSVYRFRWSTR